MNFLTDLKYLPPRKNRMTPTAIKTPPVMAAETPALPYANGPIIIVR
jgi:hypothetical protein